MKTVNLDTIPAPTFLVLARDALQSPEWDGACTCGHTFTDCRGHCTCLSCNGTRQDMERRFNGWLPDEKTCAACHEMKPQSEFWKDRCSPDGLKSRCIACSRESNAERCRNRYLGRKEG